MFRKQTNHVLQRPFTSTPIHDLSYLLSIVNYPSISRLQVGFQNGRPIYEDRLLSVGNSGMSCREFQIYVKREILEEILAV